MDEIDSLSLKLERNWVFWETDAEQDVWRQQTLLSRECESIIDKITTHSVNEETELQKIIKFLGMFYFSDCSIVPWVTDRSRNEVFKFFDLLVKKDEIQLQEVILEQLHVTLLELKKLGLNNNVNLSGKRITSRIKIREKLLGASYTQTLDKMEIFKSKFLTSLGYLNVLINHSDIKKNWNIILPVLLSFLDDTDFMVKREACISLNMTCNSLFEASKSKESNILLQSQTLPLFKTAIQPLMLALPSLTPEQKTLLILPISYDTTFKLFELCIPDKLTFYSTMSALLNDTILPSIVKCKDYVNISLELLEILKAFLEHCDIYAGVLSKPIVYTLLTVLMDPYIAHAPTVVLSCIRIIQKCIENVDYERRYRYKYDVKGCMGTLKRRMSAEQITDELNLLISSLLSTVNI
jgi:hypothetical protein